MSKYSTVCTVKCAHISLLHCLSRNGRKASTCFFKSASTWICWRRTTSAWALKTTLSRGWDTDGHIQHTPTFSVTWVQFTFTKTTRCINSRNKQTALYHKSSPYASCAYDVVWVLMVRLWSHRHELWNQTNTDADVKPKTADHSHELVVKHEVKLKRHASWVWPGVLFSVIQCSWLSQ